MHEPADGALVAVFDHDHVWVDMSDGFAVLLGRTREELVGQQARLLVHPDDEPAQQRDRERLARNGHVRGTVRLLRPDGTPVQVSYASHRLGGLFVVHAEQTGRGRPGPADDLHARAAAAVARSREMAEVVYAYEWLTPEQAVEYTKLSPATLDQMVKDGVLHRGGTKRRPRYQRQELDKAMRDA